MLGRAAAGPGQRRRAGRKTSSIIGGKVCTPYLSYAVLSDASQAPTMYRDIYATVDAVNMGMAKAFLGPGKTDSQYSLQCGLKIQCNPYPKWLKVDNVIVLLGNGAALRSATDRLSDLHPVELKSVTPAS